MGGAVSRHSLLNLVETGATLHKMTSPSKFGVLFAVILTQHIGLSPLQAEMRFERARQQADDTARQLLADLPPADAVSEGSGGKSRGKLEISIVPRQPAANVPRPVAAAATIDAFCGRAVFTDPACLSADLKLLGLSLHHAQTDLERNPMTYAALQALPGTGTEISFMEFINKPNGSTGSNIALSLLPGGILLATTIKGVKGGGVVSTLMRAGHAVKALSGEITLVDFSGKVRKAIIVFDEFEPEQWKSVYSAVIDGKKVFVKIPVGHEGVKGLEHEVLMVAKLNVLAKSAGFPDNFHIQKFMSYGELSAPLALELAAEAKPIRTLVTEAAPGIRLSEWLEDGRPLSRAAWESLKKGYDRLHELGYIHGDPNPGNIMIHQAADGKQHFTLIDLEYAQDLAAVEKTTQEAAKRIAAENHLIDSNVRNLPGTSWMR